MACYSPLRPWLGKNKTNGKKSLVYSIKESWKGESIKIPCGQCIGCRLERSRQWAVRCVHEASLYDKNCFITLTYENGRLPENGSLSVEEWQKFMKRLRKRYGNGIRYYQCGEYGELNKRPHFHALLFNHDFDDKKLFSVRNGNKIYTSNDLDRIWDNGFSVIGDVNFESAAYVARYVMKKVTGENEKEFYGILRPEFTTMSRRPGIGRFWYDKYKKEVYPVDEIIMRGLQMKPPKYYDNLLEKEEKMMYNLVKENRKLNFNNRRVEEEDGKIILVDDYDSFRLPVAEKVMMSRIKVKNRDYEKGII